MFKRRRPLPIAQRAKEVLWPRGGLMRSTRYIAHRIRRLPGTPYRIAAGFACGAAVSFTPFIGLHFVLAALTTWILRGNLIASAFGTVVGNPVTFPLIWAWLYVAGCWMLGRDPAENLPETWSAAVIFDHPGQILWPMTVSGIPTSIIAWAAFYWPVERMVAEYQRARRWRIRRKVMRRRKRMAAAHGAPAPGGAAGDTETESSRG